MDKIKLEKTYVIGCHVMWYEIEMLQEYIESCVQMMESVVNPENVTFHFILNYQEYLEKSIVGYNNIIERVDEQLSRLAFSAACVYEDSKINNESFYNIADYRRDLNYNWCNKVDFVLWGETDSLWPKQTLQIIEEISKRESSANKFVLSFAGRKNWDKTWDIITHPKYKDIQFIDTEDWALNNEASEKSYMPIQKMNEINDIAFDDIQIKVLHEPKADGSCLVISSDLIKSGVNIPHALIHCGEDESFLRMAKRIMQDQFVQYHASNILRVHNRRHPKKRTHVLNENNPRGFCGDRKGKWWNILEKKSKENLENLWKQFKFHKKEIVIEECAKLNS